jgi:Domain of unknown function (DUF4177)
MIRSRLLVVLGVAVLLCVVGLSSRANVAASATVVKWEYKVVRFEKEAEDVLNTAGADGWELASVMGTSRSAGYIFLKRQKQ